MAQGGPEMGIPWKIRKRGGTKHQLDLDVAWRRVGKAEVTAQCAGSGAEWHAAAGLGCAQHAQASGHLQEQDFAWKSRG